jgi:SAM-dependent methyltransferase
MTVISDVSTPATTLAPMSHGTDAVFGLDLLSREDRFQMNVYQGLIAGVKAFWRGDLYAEVKAEAETVPAQDVVTLERAMQERPAYFLYSWMERRLQQFKYSGRWGLEVVAERYGAQIDARLPPPDPHEQAAVPLPFYIRDIDVHQHPGGLWTAAANVVAHEWYQTGASFSGVSTDVMVDHYTETVRAAMPPNGRVLDIACTNGRTTLALKRAMPGATVEGVDICEPAVRLCRAKAAAAGLDITFTVANAEALAYPDASFDVVASHWMFHELPLAAIDAVLAEFRRVVKPGGSIMVFDMQHIPGGLPGLWLHTGYGVRNNEPFAPGYASLDMTAKLAALGFVDVRLWDFNPGNGTTGWVETLPAQRTHYSTMIVARLPDAAGEKA